MKKHFTYNSPRNIWRILISESDKLILETRDTETREVFFHCFDLGNGKKIFSDFQHEEKSWIGIETVYKDIVYFHKYIKPDMPGHKDVIAFDINTKTILWTNEYLTFLFAYEDKVICFKQGFEERFFYSLDYRTGQLLEDLGSNHILINSWKNKSETQKDWSVYLYPQNINNADNITFNIVKTYIGNLEITGNIEFMVYKNLVLFNFHSNAGNKTYNNSFAAIKADSGKVVLNEVLNAGTQSLFTDSFFIYKNFLFLLKEKNEVIIFKLE